jgi:hypothetical protein
MGIRACEVLEDVVRRGMRSRVSSDLTATSFQRCPGAKALQLRVFADTKHSVPCRSHWPLGHGHHPTRSCFSAVLVVWQNSKHPCRSITPN